MENFERKIAEEFVRNTSKNVFLTGRAGTGKTTFLRDIVKNISKNTVVVAPTGVAAINAKGVTIHSMFQVPFTAFIPSNDPVDLDVCNNRLGLRKHMKYRPDRRKLLENLELLIIDEISMVRADLLDAIDFILRTIRKDNTPFGGVQLLVIGDLFQLSPVVKNHVWPILSPYYQSPFFFDAHAWIQSHPIKIELKKIYRQKDDDFIDILNNVRLGNKVKADIDRLNQNYKELDDEDTTLTLTTHNFKADEINKRQMDALTAKTHIFSAEVKGTFKESAYPTNLNIELKEGAQVMFIRNHSEGLFFNGKLGVIEKIVADEITVHFEEDNDSIKVQKEEWNNTKYSLNKTSKKIEQEIVGSFSQYPLKLAWAITIHKSQGLTFDKVNLDLNRSFAPGQMYVALSRCRTLDGIQLNTKVLDKNIIVDRRIMNYYDNVANDEDVELILKNAKDIFSMHQLIKSFNLGALDNHIEEWNEVITTKKIPQPMKALRLQESIESNSFLLVKTAHTFQNQLLQYQEKKEPPAKIVGRAQKAITYFTDSMHKDIIEPIEAHFEMIKVKKSVKPYVKFLKELLKDIWFQMDKLYGLEYGDEAVYKEVPKHQKTILFEETDTKKEKTDTRALTLELFNTGRSIEDIARARGLTQGTIESHLSVLLNKGLVKIEQLIEEDELKTLTDYIEDNNYTSITEWVENAPFEVGFGKMRWMMVAMANES